MITFKFETNDVGLLLSAYNKTTFVLGYTNIVITSEPLSEGEIYCCVLSGQKTNVILTENENISEIQEDSDSSLFTDKGKEIYYISN